MLRPPHPMPAHLRHHPRQSQHEPLLLLLPLQLQPLLLPLLLSLQLQPLLLLLLAVVARATPADLRWISIRVAAQKGGGWKPLAIGS
jgi:hypothetical protein